MTIKTRMFLHFNDGKIRRYRKGTIRRFLFYLRSCPPAKIDILVKYGKEKNNFGHIIEFTNQYIGTDKKEAIHAIRAFLE